MPRRVFGAALLLGSHHSVDELRLDMEYLKSVSAIPNIAPKNKLKFKPHASSPFFTPPPPNFWRDPTSSSKSCAHTFQSTLQYNPLPDNLYHDSHIEPPFLVSNTAIMKLLTLNFLTCAIKACKTSPASFPLHPRDAELEIVETDFNLPFLKNILPRLMWDELRTIASEVRPSPHPYQLLQISNRNAELMRLQLGLPELPPSPPTRGDLVEGGEKAKAIEGEEQVEEEEVEEEPSQTAKDLHRVLLETCVKEGKLVCGNCGHEYKVMEGVANFLLPGHLV